MDKEAIIEVDNLSKRYKGSTNPAVDGVCINIARNEIFGLLGPNGAGKTTLISVMCGLFKPGSGKVFINGSDLHQNLKSLKKIIGIVPQDIALYPTLTAKENLLFFGHVYGLSNQYLDEKINECLAMLELENSKNKKINTFSGGMKRRINIVAGLLHNPEILFLDEPTVGIDIHSKKIIIDYLADINKKGTTIVYTSHLITEAEDFCSYIAIMNHAKIIAEGKPAELISRFANTKDLEDVFLQLTEKSLQ
ncbi:MAG TPA: ABC transporter ATP-binding protein [Bacteroidales bacterium]|nr:ABC transporter ATP-binding protein [Bacteroidales bacterium]HPS27659.1 ABC transporter ATP-binding protein [Bacteroidales bacterium]